MEGVEENREVKPTKVELSKVVQKKKRTIDPRASVYVAQIIVLFAVIFAALYNLSNGSTERELWVSLLSSSIGVILPNPKAAKIL